MQFIVYIAVLLVSISSILLELDWLTKPKVETKPAVHASTTAPAAAPRAVAKVDRPNTERESGLSEKNGRAAGQEAPPAIETAPRRRAGKRGRRAEARCAGAPAGRRARKRRRPAAAAAAQPPHCECVRCGHAGGGESAMRRAGLRQRLPIVPGIGLQLSAVRRSAPRLRCAAGRTTRSADRGLRRDSVAARTGRAQRPTRCAGCALARCRARCVPSMTTMWTI